MIVILCKKKTPFKWPNYNFIFIAFLLSVEICFFLSSIQFSNVQGRRENNEDRAAIETVDMVEGAGAGGEVDIWAVMDGHGGQFCADYSIKHFIPSLKKSIQKLKLLTCSLNNSEKLTLYEKHYTTAPKCVRKYLQISESDYDTLKCQSELKRDSSKDESDTNDLSTEKSDTADPEVKKTPSLMSRCQLVMSSRHGEIFWKKSRIKQEV